MENMSGAANGVFILPKPSPKSASKKMHPAVLGDKNGRLSAKKYTGKTPPLKPPKKHRSPDDDTEILRCKRRIEFAGRFPVQQRNPKQMAKRNERERNRVQTINSTFETLQAYLPPGYIQPKPKNKKMSKVEVLHAAIEYIRNLQDVLSETDHMAALHPHHQLPHHMQHHQQQQIMNHNGQIMMVTATSLPNGMIASTPNRSMDSAALNNIYPSPQTPSLMVNASYYNHNVNNDMHGPSSSSSYGPSSSSYSSPDNQSTNMMQQQPQQAPLTPLLPAQHQGLRVQISPASSTFSPGSVHSSPVNFDTTPEPTSSSSYMVPTASPTYGEAPLTPEDADIIMEWLHDQKQ